MRLVLPQPQASALVHGLFSLWVLDADDPLVTGVCGVCLGSGRDPLRGVNYLCMGACSDGSVPRLEPGCRVTIERCIGEWTKGMLGWLYRTCPDVWEAAMATARYGDPVVGSGVVDVVAPVVRADAAEWLDSLNAPVVVVAGCIVGYYPADFQRVDLSDNLPWLPSDLTGMVAVLLRDVEPCEPRPA